MASVLLCDPCALESKSETAIRYCSDCEEHLCKECVEVHTRFKAFRTHHIIDLKSLKSKLPTLNKNCKIHPDMLLEFFCTQHDITCCKACIADTHRSCDKILPLDVASKDIKTSSLLLDSLSSITYFLATLDKLLKNREDNLNLLTKTKSKIIQQIGNAKLKMIKHLDQLEKKLIAEVSTIQMTNENKICEQKDDLSQIQVECNQNKEDLEFFKEHGANTQLFLSLRETMKSMKNTESKIEKLSSFFTEINIEYNATEKIEKNLIGSVSEIKKPCKVEYKPKALQQAQTKGDTIKSLSEFEVDGSVRLKSGESYDITDMTITCDNNLLFCNFHSNDQKVYMYKDCKEYAKEIKFASPPYGISVIPGTDKAVVTLPFLNSIQFINSTDLTIGDKVNIGIAGYSVNATKDKIFVGGNGVVKILDSKGSGINTIRIESGDINSICYAENNDNILCRSSKSLYGCKLNGTILYQYQVSGFLGLAVDRQALVYVSMEKTKEIHRLTPGGHFKDAIGTTRSPDTLTFNNDFSKLFVVEMNESITIYKCK